MHLLLRRSGLHTGKCTNRQQLGRQQQQLHLYNNNNDRNVLPLKGETTMYRLSVNVTRTQQQRHQQQHQCSTAITVTTAATTIATTRTVIIMIINSLTARVIGAPQMILQPVFSILSCSPLPSGTCRTPGLSIP